MTTGLVILLCGLGMFLGVHAWPMVPASRERIVGRLGLNGYKLLFTLFSVLGLVFIVIGYGATRGAWPVWYPPTWTKHVAFTLMLPAMILLVAAYVPSRIRDVAKHPMLAAVKLWALAHLLVRGDVASILLFGSFLAWAIADRISVKRRGALGPLGARTGTWRGDAIVLAVGIGVYLFMLMGGHYLLVGVGLISFSFAP
jgi:uncharacterized membrane protein